MQLQLGLMSYSERGDLGRFRFFSFQQRTGCCSTTSFLFLRSFQSGDLWLIASASVQPFRVQARIPKSEAMKCRAVLLSGTWLISLLVRNKMAEMGLQTNQPLWFHVLRFPASRKSGFQSSSHCKLTISAEVLRKMSSFSTSQSSHPKRLHRSASSKR